MSKLRELFQMPAIFRYPVLMILQSALLSLVLTLQTAAQAQTGQRWALVMGIAEYQSEMIPSLDNTVNDARTMAAALNDMGFRVYLLENATKADLAATITRIGAENTGADLGFFFYAGHGLQTDGVNYALPADIDPTQADFLRTGGISIGDVIGDLRELGVSKLVVVLDACRNSPFGADEAYGTGLALVDAPDNTIIAYSTAPGAVALDGTGSNSPYTTALATALAGPQQDVRDVLRFVRARVRLSTGGAQTPWFVDNSREEMIIQPRDPVPLPENVAQRIEGDVSLLATAWRTIENSADPRDFELFAELHPEDELAEVALRQVTLLREGGMPPPPPMDLGVPDPNPAVPGGLGAIITECDVLATGTNDMMAITSPVPYNLVNIRAALRACVAAVTNDPVNPRLLGLLGRVLRLDERFEEARFYLEQSASLGNSSAYSDLSDIHRLGLGVPVDEVLSATYARLGAMMGNPNMRVALAMHYREGWGVPQSFTEARRWFELSAITGDTAAITALADMHLRGQGVPENAGLAIDYYRQAAALGKTDAMNNIGMAYMRGSGVEVDEQQGIWWLSRATEEGNPYAPYHLGRAFMRGWGVEKNMQQALAYLRLSAQRNFLGAYISIGDLLQVGGDGVEVNLTEAYANYVIAIEASKVRDTIAAGKERAEAEEKLAALSGSLSEADRAAGQKIADEWIKQYGLLDFNLVNQ
jgi:TPR repeat protein